MPRPDTTSHPVLRPVPDGVASADARWLYLPAAQGGLDAIACASGELHWHRDDAVLALLCDAARVLVLEAADAGRLRPRWLNADSGAPIQQPPGALPPVLPHLAGAVGAWAITRSAWQGDRLLLSWSARQFSAGRPAVLHGVMALDPAHLAQAAEVADWPPAPPWPGGPGDVPFADGGAPLPAWQVQGETVALALREGTAGARSLLLLRQGRAAVAAAVLVDTLPTPGWLQALASPDAGLVTLLHTRAPGGAGPADARPSLWRLFAAPDGAALATLPAEDGLMPPFYRVGDLLLCIQLGALAHKRARPGRVLRAWRVADGRPAWQHPLPERSPQRMG